MGFSILLLLNDVIASDSLFDLLKGFFLLVLILLLDLTLGVCGLGCACFILLFLVVDLVCLWFSSFEEDCFAWYWLVCFFEDCFSLSLLLVLWCFEDCVRKLELSKVLFLKVILDGSFSICSFVVFLLVLLKVLVVSFWLVELRLDSEYLILAGFLTVGNPIESSKLLFLIFFGGESETWLGWENF